MVTLFVTFLYMNLFVSTWQWWATKISVQYIFDASGSFPVFFNAVGSFFSASRLRDKLRGSMRIARRKLCLRNHIKPRPTSGARYPFPSGSKTHLSCQNIRWRVWGPSIFHEYRFHFGSYLCVFIRPLERMITWWSHFGPSADHSCTKTWTDLW